MTLDLRDPWERDGVEPIRRALAACDTPAGTVETLCAGYVPNRLTWYLADRARCYATSYAYARQTVDAVERQLDEAAVPCDVQRWAGAGPYHGDAYDGHASVDVRVGWVIRLWQAANEHADAANREVAQLQDQLTAAHDEIGELRARLGMPLTLEQAA